MTYFYSILLSLGILGFFWATVPLVIYLSKDFSLPVKMALILFSWLCKMIILFSVFVFVAPMGFYDRNSLIIILLTGSLIIFILEIRHFKV
ncbi:MAG: hypothetical protein LBT99_00145 [Bifidobacteriaceae bacterium]|jgi:hypothetical protein|nr:hypothetical protein [Bifidobacteriaceae bacterium]